MIKGKVNAQFGLLRCMVTSLQYTANVIWSGSTGQTTKASSVRYQLWVLRSKVTSLPVHSKQVPWQVRSRLQSQAAQESRVMTSKLSHEEQDSLRLGVMVEAEVRESLDLSILHQVYSRWWRQRWEIAWISVSYIKFTQDGGGRGER